MNKASPHLVPHTRLDSGERCKSFFVKAPDGLKLHVQEYGSRAAPGIPVVCLPGLLRTVADFDELAPALAAGPPERHVIAIDSRGRGHSDHDADHANYNCTVELGDIVSVLFALEVRPAIFIGSSRGGVLTMLMGAAHPTGIAGVVLHDVGPVTEPKGIARIRGYLGKLPRPQSFKEGADILRRLLGHQFPNLSDEEWLWASQRTWHLKQGALKPAYDHGILNALAGIDVEAPTMPTLWHEFDALADVPMLVIRGEHSDILSAATVEAMRKRRKSMDVIEVPGQGHAPLLVGALVERIVRFAASCEAAHKDAAPTPQRSREF